MNRFMAIGTCVVSVVLGLAAALGEPSPSGQAGSSETDAQSVVAASARAHKAMRSFAATCVLYKDEQPHSVGRLLFDRDRGFLGETALINPRPAVMETLRSAFRHDAGTGVWEYMTYDGPVKGAESEGEAFGQVFAVAQAWRIVPIWLLASGEDATTLPYAAEATGVGTPCVLGGVECVRVRLSAPIADVGEFVLWIDQETQLVRQIEESRGSERPTWRLIMSATPDAQVSDAMLRIKSTQRTPLSTLVPKGAK